MRNIWALVIILLFGAAALYFLAPGSFDISFDRIVEGSQEENRSMKLNARGVSELAEGLDERAVDTLKEAADLNPGNPVVRRNLSIALARSAMLNGRDENTALDMLKESLALWPQNPEALDGMTTIHFRNSRYEKALEYAQKLQIVLPDRPDLDDYVVHLEQRAASVKGMVYETGDRFRLLYSGNKRLEYEGVITAVLQEHMDALTAALGIFPENPVDVFILTEDLGNRADPLTPYMEGLYDGQIRLYMGDGIEDMDKFVQTVRHEMIHALLHEAVGVLPGWVHEGLAQKVGEDPSRERIDMARRYIKDAISKGYAVNIASLDMTFIDMEEEERSRAYATSLLFMDWLVLNYGDHFIPKFVSEISLGNSPEEALENVTRTDFDLIQELFKNYLGEGA